MLILAKSPEAQERRISASGLVRVIIIINITIALQTDMALRIIQWQPILTPTAVKTNPPFAASIVWLERIGTYHALYLIMCNVCPSYYKLSTRMTMLAMMMFNYF